MERTDFEKKDGFLGSHLSKTLYEKDCKKLIKYPVSKDIFL